MLENENMQVNEEPTNTAEGGVEEETTLENETSTTEEESSVEDEKEENSSFTQEQVNEIVRNRLEKDRNNFLNRYGVKDREELDTLVGKSQSYDIIKERYDALQNDLASTKKENAFLKNNINPERYDDITAHFKGKGVEFNEDSLKQELETHPEWLNVVKETTIRKLGVEHEKVNMGETREEKLRRIYGI